MTRRILRFGRAAFARLAPALLALAFAAASAAGQEQPDPNPAPRAEPPAPPAGPGACVVLLHGLARTGRSMETAAEILRDHGYLVANVDYPSRDKPVRDLAAEAVPAGIAACRRQGASRIHFLTHSLGGILVRVQFTDARPPELGRVVMLAPPNQGSEAVDALSEVPGFGLWHGPAGYELGTGPESVPLRLGPVDFEVGVVAGTTSFNPFTSLTIPGEDDGKVAVARTRVDGMADFITVPHSHTFIMESEDVVRLAIRFFERGRFRSLPGN